MKSPVFLALILMIAGHEGRVLETERRSLKGMNKIGSGTSIPCSKRSKNILCDKTYPPETEEGGNTFSTRVAQPWLAGIYRPVGLAADYLVCEGTLIHERYVLTTASCVNNTRNSLFRVVLGDFDVEGYVSEDRTVKRKIVHEDFKETNATGFLNDIALLELAKPVRFDGHIMPICLPPKNTNAGGSQAIVMGWSDFEYSEWQMPPPEREIDVEVDRNDLCSAWFSAEYSKETTLETLLCARPALGKEGPCRDGTALIMRKDGRAFIIGVASGVPPRSCGRNRDPTLYTEVLALYTNVTNYVDWIESNLKNSLEPVDGDEERPLEERSLIRLRESIDSSSVAINIGIVVLVAVLLVLVLTALRLVYCYNLARQLQRRIVSKTGNLSRTIVVNDSML